MLNSNQEILIIGDIMLDVYQHVEVNRISPESPTPICDVKNITYAPGGAGNVAANITSLGGNVHLIGRIGFDANGEILEKTLKRNKISFYGSRSHDYKTPTKVRTVSEHHHIVRHDFGENQHHVVTGSPYLEQLSNTIVELSKKVKAIVISDYNKGFITRPIYATIINNSNEVPIFIDTKQNIINFWGKKIFAFKPNMKEFEYNIKLLENEGLYISPNNLLFTNEIEAFIKYLRGFQGTYISNVLVTHGKEGMILGTLVGDKYNAWQINPMKKLNVYDVTGAGDTAMAAFVMACVSGYSTELAAGIANIASGIACSKLGTSTVSILELIEVNAFQEAQELVRKI